MSNEYFGWGVNIDFVDDFTNELKYKVEKIETEQQLQQATSLGFHASSEQGAKLIEQHLNEQKNYLKRLGKGDIPKWKLLLIEKLLS